MTKVLLIQPLEYRRYYDLNPDYKRYFSRELGLLQLSSFLKENNIESGFISGHYKKDEYFRMIKKEIKKKDPDIIGTTCLTPEYNITKDIIDFAKQLNPNINAIIGGHHTTWLDTQTLKDSQSADIVVRGEGEKTFLDIAKNKPLEKIKGITYKKNKKENDKIIRNPNQQPLQIIPKLDSSVLKDYSKKINNSNLDFFQFNYTSTRGCPFKCSFCTEPKYWGNDLRFKKIRYVKEEIDTILENKRCKRIFFMDSNFTINQKYTKQFCKEIKEVIDIKNNKTQTSFKCYTKIGGYTKETAVLLKKSGFDVVHFGVEHFNKDIQRSINKINTMDEIKKTLKNAKQAGQNTGIYIVVGLPGDTIDKSKENYRKTQDLVKENLLDEVIPFTFIPYPGTDHFSDPQKYNLKILTKDFSRYTRTHPPVINYDEFNSDEIEIMFKVFSDYAQELSLKNQYTSMFSEPQ